MFHILDLEVLYLDINGAILLIGLHLYVAS